LSSILRALKRLEQEGVEKQSEKGWPDSFQTLKEKGRRVRSQQKAMLIFSLFLALFVFSGGLIFYSFRDAVEAPQTSVEVKNHSITPAPKHPSTRPAKQGLIDNIRPSTARIPAIEKKPVIDLELFSTETQQTVNSETQVSGRIRNMPAGNKMDFQTRVPEVRNDPRIDLQAIAWAADEKKSFAVINNRILKKGHNFDGITVTKIDKDEVCFREGHNEWCQKFRIQ